jgi:hypothetical protein
LTSSFGIPVRVEPHRITKDWQMKSVGVIALSLLWSSMALADPPNHWEVAVPGSDQPYMCNECALRTPFPDSASALALNAWKSGQSPFSGPVDMKGVRHPLKNGDQVILCNQTGCSTYTWQEPGGWSHGIFQREESHGPNSASCAGGAGLQQLH